MADVKWIKICTDVFDDEKILMIEGLPSADSIITIWFKLLVLAGKQNNNGVFLMNDKIAYTDEMLSLIFRRDLQTVRMAIKTFQNFGMIDVIDDVITIPNWNKHQTLDAYEKKKERDRRYRAERRASQKALIEKSSDRSSDRSLDRSSAVVVSEKEEDIDKDINILSKDNIRSTPKELQRVVDAWNELGLQQVVKITEGTERYKQLKKRIKDYGIETVLQAIEKVKCSPFLQNSTFFSFDWMIKPNNFPKVLEGNYEERSEKKSGTDTRTDKEPPIGYKDEATDKIYLGNGKWEYDDHGFWD